VPQRTYSTTPGQCFRKPKLFSKHAKKKNLIKRDTMRAVVPIALDAARPRHKSFPTNPHTNKTISYKDGKKVIEYMGSGTYEPETGPLTVDQNYDIIKRTVEVSEKTGKIVIKYKLNNPPGKRYYPRSESLIAEGNAEITPHFAYVSRAKDE